MKATKVTEGGTSTRNRRREALPDGKHFPTGVTPDKNHFPSASRKIFSTHCPNNLPIFNANGKLGSYFSVSIALMV